MIQVDDLSLFSKIPTVRRAREYYLYDTKGRRFLDLFQQNGRALMGHRPHAVYKEMKNVLSRGLAAGYPTVYERRFLKALSELFPNYRDFRYYSSWEKARKIVEQYRGTRIPEPIFDPAIEELSGVDVALWRPFTETEQNGAEILIPILPFSMDPEITIVCFKSTIRKRIPASDRISGVLLAGLSRSIYACIKHMRTVDTETWHVFDVPIWKRRGPYLCAVCSSEEYTEIFERFLQHRMVLSPLYPGPSIVPAVFTEGDITLLKTLRKECL
jgi:hypothetical protein